MVKELKIRYKKPNGFEIYYEGGGEVPEVLQGSWTDRGKAQIAIDKYLLTRPVRKTTKKVEDDAEG